MDHPVTATTQTRPERAVRAPRTLWLVVLLSSLGIAVYFPGQYYLAGLQSAAADGT